jgi:hypothetical protein
VAGNDEFIGRLIRAREWSTIDTSVVGGKWLGRRLVSVMYVTPLMINPARLLEGLLEGLSIDTRYARFERTKRTDRLFRLG